MQEHSHLENDERSKSRLSHLLIVEQAPEVVPIANHFTSGTCLNQFLQAAVEYIRLRFYPMYIVYPHTLIKRRRRPKIIPRQGSFLERADYLRHNLKFCGKIRTRFAPAFSHQPYFFQSAAPFLVEFGPFAGFSLGPNRCNGSPLTLFNVESIQPKHKASSTASRYQRASSGGVLPRLATTQHSRSVA